MKINGAYEKQRSLWEQAGYLLPAFDRQKMLDSVKQAPRWLHFGPGNIFRAFIAALQQSLLDQAEATILPVTDVKTAREGFRDFLARYNEYGKVPRDAIRPLENRVRALEHAIKAAEDDEWRRTDPEARKRASDTVEMFTTQIEKLAKQADDAEARGDLKKAQKTRESIKTYTEWLNQATKALDEFSGNGA